MTVSDSSEPLLTTEQVAKHLGVVARTLYEMRKRGEGPPVYNLGAPSSVGPYRYRLSEVDAWVADTEARTGTLGDL